MPRLKQTPLYHTHKTLGARMVEFAGWEMPAFYRGVREEHEAVRRRVGLFDVSHMGEIVLTGKDAWQAVQYLSCNDLRRLKPGKCQYSALLNFEGTFIDDVIVYPLNAEKILLCVNAGNAEKDLQWIEQQVPAAVAVRDESAEWGQLALQGPKAQVVLQSVAAIATAEMERFAFRECLLAGIPTLVSRTGYTGEDGFEIYLPAERTASLWNELMTAGTEAGIEPCGLGARDTLRLEAGYPLYGHEIGETITPFEAGLNGIVKLDSDDFIGRAALLESTQQTPAKKLIGFVMDERAVPRTDYPIYSGGVMIGRVASGTYAPSLEKGIGTGYIHAVRKPSDQRASVDFTSRERAGGRGGDVSRAFPPYYGAKIDIDIRGKKRKATVVRLPFYCRRS